VSEYLTPDDVAAITGLSVYTIRAAVRDGQLRATKPRRRILIHRDALADWLDDNTVRPGRHVEDRSATRRTPTARRPAAASYDDMDRARQLRRQRKDAA
jgi:excisionase family DNA binding protein